MIVHVCVIIIGDIFYMDTYPEDLCIPIAQERLTQMLGAANKVKGTQWEVN